MRKSGNVQGREIEISESTPEIFQQFLEFIYADKFEANLAGALELMQLSQKYKVHPLTKKCEELLKNDIPIVDSVKIFETARRYGRPELMNRAGQVMVKSFIKLARTDSLANAEEEALVYLLECDDLAAKEVGLFQFILDWGKNQVGASVDDGLLKNKLKNLISKIRFTNMTPDEFTKVVVPTGLLPAEVTISVLSYFCGDEVTRKDLKVKLNTTQRKLEHVKMVARGLDFYAGLLPERKWLPAFSKHSISFNASGIPIDGKVQPDYSLRKIVITAIHFQWPVVHSKLGEHHVLNFNVSVVECSGPGKEGNLLIRCQKKLWNCQPNRYDQVSVEPPVELVAGKTYSVIVEDHTTSDSIESFRKDPCAYGACIFPNVNPEANVDFEDVSLTLRDIHSETDFYTKNSPDWSGELNVIRWIEIGLL